jgi:photosystem II stability/assembly factor-like uncharacterized protein
VWAYEPAGSEEYKDVDWSSNGGRTWRHQKGPTGYWAMDAQLLADGRHGWIAAGGGVGVLLATSDAGRHWKQLLIPTSKADEVDVTGVWFTSPLSGSILLRHDGGRYAYSLDRTSDGGRSWHVLQRWLHRP